MPFYTMSCDCGHTFEVQASMANAPQRARCECGNWAHRDYLADLPRVQTDPDACTADLDRRLQQASEDQQVTDRYFSRSLARVPGIPKVKGKDGKVYAAFRNKRARRRTLGRIGMHDAH